MAELSFGHNLRAKRKEVVNNTLSFLPWAQGCLTACAPAGTPSSLESGSPFAVCNTHASARVPRARRANARVGRLQRAARERRRSLMR